MLIFKAWGLQNPTSWKRVSQARPVRLNGPAIDTCGPGPRGRQIRYCCRDRHPSGRACPWMLLLCLIANLICYFLHIMLKHPPIPCGTWQNGTTGHVTNGTNRDFEYSAFYAAIVRYVKEYSFFVFSVLWISPWKVIVGNSHRRYRKVIRIFIY